LGGPLAFIQAAELVKSKNTTSFNLVTYDSIGNARYVKYYAGPDINNASVIGKIKPHDLAFVGKEYRPGFFSAAYQYRSDEVVAGTLIEDPNIEHEPVNFLQPIFKAVESLQRSK
jgi:hypothetical protein